MRVDRVEDGSDRRIGQTDGSDGPDDPPIEFAGRDRSISSITGPVPSGRPTDRFRGWVDRNARENEPRPDSFGGVDRGGCVKPYGFIFIMCDFILERVVSVVLKAFDDQCVVPTGDVEGNNVSVTLHCGARPSSLDGSLGARVDESSDGR